MYCFYFLLILAQHLAAHSADGADSVLPSVMDFGVIIQHWAERCSEASEIDDRFYTQFVTEQLLRIALIMDFSDEASRRAMASVITSLLQLPLVPDGIVEQAMEVSKVLYNDEADRVRVIAEIISEIRQPIQEKLTTETKAQARSRAIEKSKITVQMTELRIKLDELVKSQLYTEAAEVKRELKELEAAREDLSEPMAVEDDQVLAPPKSDPETLRSCLAVMKGLLRSTTLTANAPELAMLVNTLILSSAKNPDPDVRNDALSALGMACVRSPTAEMGQQHFSMFLLVLQLDQDAIKQTALKILFDLVLVFGVEAFSTSHDDAVSPADEIAAVDESSDNNAEKVKKSIVAILQKYLHDENESLRTIAVEGICKLFLMNHVTSPKLISQLVLLQFSPTTSDDHKIRQCLNFFFPAFAFSSTTHAMLMDEAFLPTLRQAIFASRDSPLRQIKPAVLAKFFVYHTSQSEGAGRRGDAALVHESVAMKVLNEMLSSPEKGAELKVLGSILPIIDVSEFSSLTVKSLRFLTAALTKKLPARSVERKQVTEIEARLLAAADPSDLTEEERAAMEKMMAEHTAARKADVGEAEFDSSEVEKRSTRTQRAGKKRTKVEEPWSSADDDEFVAEEAPATVSRPTRAVAQKTPKAVSMAALDSGEDAAKSGSESESDETVYVIEKIIDHKKVGRGFQYLVKWENFDDAENSWEPTRNLPAAMVKAYKAAQSDTTKQAKKPSQAKESKKSSISPEATAAYDFKSNQDKQEIKTIHKKASERDNEREIDALLDDVTSPLVGPVAKTKGGRSRRTKGALAEIDNEVDELLA